MAMRILLVFITLLAASVAKAQNLLPGSFIDMGYRGNMLNQKRFTDSSNTHKKWFVTHYASLSTSYMFSKAGNATIVAAPVGIQLNRKLNDNFYAFAGASIAPAYVNFRSSFLSPEAGKTGINNYYRNNGAALFSRAELGLMYVNDEKTFSISGSIGVQRSSYPLPAAGYRRVSTINNGVRQ